MIADDRGSQIADNREASCFHIIADDRERSQSRLLPRFRSAEVSKLQALCAGGTIASKQHDGRRGRNLSDVIVSFKTVKSAVDILIFDPFTKKSFNIS